MRTGLISRISKSVIRRQQHISPHQAALTTGRRRLQACLCMEGSKCTLASASSVAPQEAGASSEASNRGASYVSPHDWSSITREYGKSEAAAGPRLVEIHAFEAKTRTLDEQGSRCSRKIRKEGLLPGVLYGVGVDGDQTRVLVTINRFELERQMRRLEDSICSTVFDLQVDEGKYSQRVIIRDIDREPGTGVPLAANFLRYRPGYPVKVPVCFINEELCIALKRGGMLLSINRFVPVICEGETIPEMLMVDLTGVRPNQKIGIEKAIFPEGVKPFGVQEGYILGIVKGKNLGYLGGGETGGDEGADAGK